MQVVVEAAQRDHDAVLADAGLAVVLDRDHLAPGRVVLGRDPQIGLARVDRLDVLPEVAGELADQVLEGGVVGVGFAPGEVGDEQFAYGLIGDLVLVDEFLDGALPSEQGCAHRIGRGWREVPHRMQDVPDASPDQTVGHLAAVLESRARFPVLVGEVQQRGRRDVAEGNTLDGQQHAQFVDCVAAVYLAELVDTYLLDVLVQQRVGLGCDEDRPVGGQWVTPEGERRRLDDPEAVHSPDPGENPDARGQARAHLVGADLPLPERTCIPSLLPRLTGESEEVLQQSAGGVLPVQPSCAGRVGPDRGGTRHLRQERNRGGGELPVRPRQGGRDSGFRCDRAPDEAARELKTLGDRAVATAEAGGTKLGLRHRTPPQCRRRGSPWGNCVQRVGCCSAR